MIISVVQMENVLCRVGNVMDGMIALMVQMRASKHVLFPIVMQMLLSMLVHLTAINPYYNVFHIRCSNKKCIRKSALCDGINDCGNREDESDEVCAALPKCRHDQFQCENDDCISKIFRCDGKH